MNERIKEVRKVLSLNQSEFGAKFGVTAAAVSKIEKGERNVTDRVIADVCREFNVNEEWLRTGAGEMFARADESIVDQLAQEFNLDEWGIRTLSAYMKLDTPSRKAISRVIIAICKEYGVDVSEETNADTTPPPSREPLSIKEQADLLRARADALEKGHVESSTTEKQAQ